MKIIAHIETCFDTKFGVPRQAGIVDTPGRIVFEPQYRVADAVRGLEGFDYIWLIWQFSKAVRDDWSPTVRPPRLGGNERMGVFATRSPFRPNAIGLSSVRLVETVIDPELGPVLYITGADLMDGTPIYDIKPYLPYTDSHPDARSGFATRPAEQLLEVEYSQSVLSILPTHLQQALIDVLAHDPRPQYHNDPTRIYGMSFAGYEVKFSVSQSCLTLIDIQKSAEGRK
ncbi:MAG: tRNA (N6-threonylcarbamoyladenosine(37)-N6)-methyltransferase TrmO [Bacteroidales bacterium]|nr:tRNA (N6-threonylcarbamoyladenosine(37)-N6)-methyltransferase TrmO [Candidatus Colimorpha merdihippi]